MWISASSQYGIDRGLRVQMSRYTYTKSVTIAESIHCPSVLILTLVLTSLTADIVYIFEGV